MLKRIAPLLFAVSISLFASLPSEKVKWIELKTDRFHLVSTISEKRSREILIEFERFRSALERALGKGKASGQTLAMPFRVYLFEDQKMLESYTELKDRSGVFYWGPMGSNVLLNASFKESRELVYHEYFHDHLRLIAPELKYPLWANEGLACFYEGTKIDSKQVTFGTPRIDYLRLLMQYPRMQVGKLLNVTHESPEYNQDITTSRFYASSWLTTHYLLAGDMNRRKQLSEYLGRIQAGQDEDTAFSMAFKCLPEVLDNEVELYFRKIRASMPVLNIPLDNAMAEPVMAIRTLSRAESLGLLGQQLLGRSAWVENAYAHLQESLKLDAKCIPALTGMGFLEISGYEKAKNTNWLDQALKITSDPICHHLRIRRRVREYFESKDMPQILKDLDMSTSAGIGDYELISYLAGVLQGMQIDAESLAILTRVAQRAPECMELRLAELYQFWKSGEVERAKKGFEPLFEDPRMRTKANELFQRLSYEDEQEIKRKNEIEVDLKLREASANVSAGDLVGAEQLLRGASLLPMGDHKRRALEEFLAEIGRAQAAEAKNRKGKTGTKKQPRNTLNPRKKG